MIRSMTGYGRNVQMIDGKEISVEIKSVNHRYFEFNARVPRIYGYLEKDLKDYIQPLVSRGKIDVGVNIVSREDNLCKVEINTNLVAGYINALREAKNDLDLFGEIEISHLLQLPDVFSVRREEENEETVWSQVRQVCSEAMKMFVSMRETEGAKMMEDIESRLSYIENLVEKVEVRSPQRVTEYRERLTAKMQAVLSDTTIDEQRILTEAAIYSERVAVDEETVRLRSHLMQFRSILDAGGGVGRKLDFLVQEINRETNTIGSKANDVETAQIVVEMKSEIEKIREQIQNLE